ncbi:MAG TPA: DUF2520 domain-containing protein, partial [Gammaproteobacteria bacterium]|nr:DUF2520 domain-containing protein [Gammaproteobacteria bacterium]
MRQVPYLIIGSGRMATHMQRYFDLLHLSYLTWSRKKNTSSELHLLAQQSERVLLLIKDDVIANFIAEYGFLKDKILIHFSGNLLLEGVYSAHPLMTFIPEAYDLATYQIIPYILEENAPDFNQLLPGLPNH